MFVPGMFPGLGLNVPGIDAATPGPKQTFSRILSRRYKPACSNSSPCPHRALETPGDWVPGRMRDQCLPQARTWAIHQ